MPSPILPSPPSLTPPPTLPSVKFTDSKIGKLGTLHWPGKLGPCVNPPILPIYPGLTNQGVSGGAFCPTPWAECPTMP